VLDPTRRIVNERDSYGKRGALPPWASPGEAFASREHDIVLPLAPGGAGRREIECGS